ncbi:UNVERIFIED_CONTAM: hypothetical protein GTU68_060823 [Idotea baltica]|nr:hypothetical protein [Idotea baltica]
MYRLNRNGFKGYLVGGAIRDILLGKQPKDFDLATDATPKEIKNLFRNSRIIGKRFKLVHIYFKNNKIIEVATFRDYEDESNSNEDDIPDLLPTDNNYGDEESDALRRDLTINALFYSIENFSIIDYVGGVEDLNNRVAKILGNPLTSLIEDPVRMLRVVRHAARAGFEIDSKTIEAINEHRELIMECPDMRIYEELKKDLLSGYSLPTLRLFQTHGLLKFILPEIDELKESLFEDKSHLAMALEKADTHYRIHNGTLITPILSLLSIVTHPEYEKDKSFKDCIKNKDELYNYLCTRFQSYAVPKRERERIFIILSALLLIEKNILEKINPDKLPNDTQIKELVTLIKFLEYLPRRAELTAFLNGVRKAKRQERFRNKRKKRTRI